MRPPGGVQGVRSVSQKVPHLQRSGQRYSPDLPLVTRRRRHLSLVCHNDVIECKQYDIHLYLLEGFSNLSVIRSSESILRDI